MVLAAVRHKVVWGHAAEVAVPTLRGHTDLPHFRQGLLEAAWRTEWRPSPAAGRGGKGNSRWLLVIERRVQAVPV